MELAQRAMVREQAGPIAIDEVRLPMNPSNWI